MVVVNGPLSGVTALSTCMVSTTVCLELQCDCVSIMQLIFFCLCVSYHHGKLFLVLLQ
jgi:hypothetical protein